MFSIKSKKNIYVFIVLVPLLFAQGCAVLTDSQVDVVGDFAKAADKYSDLPGSVVEMHANTMLAENIYFIASLSAPDSISRKLSSSTKVYLDTMKKAREADAALNVIDTYVKLLTKLTSNDFTEQLQEEAGNLGTEIDGAVRQYNTLAGTNIDGFGAAVASVIRAGGGIIIRYKQTKALKKAVDGAEPVIKEISKSVTDLMDSYISSLGPLAAKGLVDEYKGLLNSKKSNNSVKDVQNVSQLLLKAKTIKPLAEKTKKAMITFQAAHTKLYDKLKERQTLKGAIAEIKVLYGEIRSAQKLKKEIEG